MTTAACPMCELVAKEGELHVADWGKAATPWMRTLFPAIQILDGFPSTADNVRGRLPEVFARQVSAMLR